MIKRLGPGLIYAGAAVGVSHLVQCTRAGANFALDLILAIILIHVLKYGFFKAGAVIPMESGKDLIYAYRKKSPWALRTFLLMSVSTMHIVIAAITLVCAGLLANILKIQIPIHLFAFPILLLAILVNIFGNVDRLGAVLKYLVLALSLITVFCLVLQFPEIMRLISQYQFPVFKISAASNWAFLLAFLGWMPAPMDITLWQSTWITASKTKRSNKDQLFDFNMGYWGTALLAICFVLIGAAVLYNKEVVLPSSAVGFTAQFVDMYVASLGNWVRPFIAFTALATMFSTLITCLDAYPRSIKRCMEEVNVKDKKLNSYGFWTWITGLGAYVIIYFFGSSLPKLIDFVTTVSFVLAPIIAGFNYQILFSGKPYGFWKTTSLIGILVLSGFSLLYFLI